ncbi:PHP domain-containing protein [Tepidiforma sp.]|uniref:PHP domain-containing protein n=1 Tax=Tepidiforma sp. TaxID=2682230 RepID=UPI002ADE0C81|nr:PHP-associated domain-containing protein [Tepidiforma sp.]
MGKADLHLHSRASDGLASIEQLLEYVEHCTDLDVIAVTDHEDVRGGLRAQELAARRGYRFEVIPGAEVTTLQGHVLALFIERDPPSFRGVEFTLGMIHDAGGLAIAPHPLSWLTRSIGERTLNTLAERSEAGVGFDAIEVANASPAGRRTAQRAARLNAERWGLATVGSSDAHHLEHVGAGWTEFPGRSAADLRAALLSGTTRGAMLPAAKAVPAGRAALGLAWGYTATPRKALQMARRWR